jgi:hypothetical protein
MAAAAATGIVSLGLAAYAADQILDAPKLKTLPQKVRTLISESDKLKKSPVGLLFKLSK